MSAQSRQKFLTMFNDILSDQQGSSKMARLQLAEAKGDEVDLVNVQKEKALTERLGQRNILFLKKVEEAKQRILDGTYGLCEECGVEISQKRLSARPTAKFCIGCQEDKERGEKSSFHKRRDLNSKKFRDESEDDHIAKIAKFSNVKDISFESIVD